MSDIKQGGAYKIKWQITDMQGQPIELSLIDKAIFKIGCVSKTYDGTGAEVQYDTDKKCFDILLTQAETMQMQDNVLRQAKILYNNGLADLTDKAIFNVKESIIKVVL